MRTVAAIPSPSQSVWYVGPIPIRAYALCIVAGILVAMYLCDRAIRARGADEDVMWNVAKWAVPFGVVGGRIYHVVTDPELYFTNGNNPVNALKIWDGGLGIPGAIALGTLGAWIGCRKQGIRLDSFGDASVAGVALAQAIGRMGNWFNNELYGRPTDLPWRLQIHCIDVEDGKAFTCPSTGSTVLGYYQPTFLYELLWDVALAGFLMWAARRYALGRGRVFALYAMGYTAGRFWVELLRSDTANHILGLRVNTWTSMLVFLAGLAWFLTHRGPREESIFRAGHPPELADGTDGTDEPADSTSARNVNTTTSSGPSDTEA